MICTALRLEWAKCKARADRWREELMLLEEEMRRVIAYGVSKEAWWRQRPACRPNVVDPALLEGLHAYAIEHADIERAFCVMLAAKWADIRLRTQTILDELSQPGFPEQASDTPIVVDLEEDEDPEDGCWDKIERKEGEEAEEAEVEMIA